MWKITTGNNIDVLRTYEDNTFDSVVTDPPYGIAFLNKSWDQDTGALATWQECFRVLKPGGYLLAFSAARTYHHLATNIEQSGFEIRDQLMWLYGSGFPKAQDIGKAIERREGKRVDAKRGTTNTHEGGMKCHKCNKVVAQGIGFKGCVSNEDECPIEYTQRPADNEWAGWKTALKPAHEPIVMARKPMKGSTIDNVLEHGVGALNIDASRIGNEEVKTVIKRNKENTRWYGHRADNQSLPKPVDEETNVGRFPSNVIMDAEAGAILDAQAPKTGNGHRAKTKVTGYGKFGGGSSSYAGAGEKVDGLSGASKFFYCPKVSRAERHAGFETKNIPADNPTNGGNYYGTSTHPTDPKLKQQQTGNNHPTVKPVELMKYLVRLVTPANGKVLDPFNGSGSTGMACVELGYDYVGCELDENYVEIAEKRIKAWENKHKGFSDLFEENA